MFRETLGVRLWALRNVPLLFFVRPSVIELSDSRCVIEIRLRRRTRNHLRSMYFAALCAGADCAGGLMAMRRIEAAGGGVSLIFKDFNAEFLKRPEANVHFTCEDGVAIAGLVERVLGSGEREEMPVAVTATVPSLTGHEPVAKFRLTLSLKKKGMDSTNPYISDI